MVSTYQSECKSLFSLGLFLLGGVAVIVVSSIEPLITTVHDNSIIILTWFIAIVFFGLEFYVSIKSNSLQNYSSHCLAIEYNKIRKKYASEVEIAEYDEINKIEIKLAEFCIRRSITWIYCALGCFWSLIFACMAFLLVLLNIDFWIVPFYISGIFLATTLGIHAFRIGFKNRDWAMDKLAIFPFLMVEFPGIEDMIDELIILKWV